MTTFNINNYQQTKTKIFNMRRSPQREYSFFNPESNIRVGDTGGMTAFRSMLYEGDYKIKLADTLWETDPETNETTKGYFPSYTKALISCDLTQDYGCKIEKKLPKEFFFLRVGEEKYSNHGVAPAILYDDDSVIRSRSKDIKKVCLLGPFGWCNEFSFSSIDFITENEEINLEKIYNIVLFDNFYRGAGGAKLSQNKDHIIFSSGGNTYALDIKTKKKKLIAKDSIPLDMR